MKAKTPDGKVWEYDSVHHEWIDVSINNPQLKRLLKHSARIK